MQPPPTSQYNPATEPQNLMGGVPHQQQSQPIMHPPPPYQYQQQQQQHHHQQQQPSSPPPQPTMASIPPKTKLYVPSRGRGIITNTPDEEMEDGRIRNAEAMDKIRNDWMYRQISARREEFTQYKNVSLDII